MATDECIGELQDTMSDLKYLIVVAPLDEEIKNCEKSIN